LIRPFTALALILLLMLFVVSIHYTLFPYTTQQQKIQALTQLTGYSALSLSQRHDTTAYNVTYPEMPTLGRMDFVYEP
jgi:hypothetical protein